MAQFSYFQSGGINTYVNPLLQDGQLIRAVNVDSYPYGAKIKRPGYTTYLGTPDSSSILRLFSWTQDNGTQLWTYRQSGTNLFYSTQGTGAWTQCGNGTLTAGTLVDYTVLNNTLIISQGAGTTRHTTNGTSFTNTTSAPAGNTLEQYQNRVYITGTSSTLTYGVTGDPTNWSTTGTSDSSSVTIPGAGLPHKLFKLNNRLNIGKNSGQQFRWDGFNLIDMATELGPSSPVSYARTEDTGFWLNRLGIFASSGGKPQILSNSIQGQIYNDGTTGIAGATFGTAPGVVHNYDYLVAVGSIQDDFTNEPLNNGIIKYNYQKNEMLNYQFNDFPTAWHSFTASDGNRQLIFGNSTGQAMTFGTTNLTDNTVTIPTVMDYVFHFGAPYLDKDMRWFWGFFNPGCEAQVQIALSDNFVKGRKSWVNLGDARSGVIKYRFPTGSRGKFCYLRINDASRNARYIYYGCSFDFTVVNPG